MLLDAMKEDPEWFRDRRSYLALSIPLKEEEEAEFEENKERIKAQHGEHYECYWGWPDLPTDAHLLSVEMAPSGKAKFYGFYLRHSWMPAEDGEFQLCQHGEGICGFRMPKKTEWPRWKRMIEEAWQTLPDDARAEAYWVDLHAIATRGMAAALQDAVARG